MTIISRIKRIVTANINGLIEKAEDPETMIKEMIREMDENIIKMRNEIVKSVAAEKWLARQMETAGKKIGTWRENSEKAIREGDEDLARKAVDRMLQEEQTLAEMREHQKRAAGDSTALKNSSACSKTRCRTPGGKRSSWLPEKKERRPTGPCWMQPVKGRTLR
jgi:phage shock protein A